jgi:hypothetical protein
LTRQVPGGNAGCAKESAHGIAPGLFGAEGKHVSAAVRHRSMSPPVGFRETHSAICALKPMHCWRNKVVKRLIVTLLLLAAVVPIAGCVIEGGGGRGWCYWHPERCR